MSRACRTSAFHAALKTAAGAVLLLGGCASSSLNSAPSPLSRVGSAPGTASSGASKASDWLAQAWASWQRAQASPSRPASPTPRLAFQAPAPLEPSLLERLQLAPASFNTGVLSLNLGLSGARLGELPVAPGLAPSASSGSEGFAGSELWKRALREVELGSARPPGPRQGSVESNWSALQEEMERRQVAALQELALRVARQRREASADEEGLLRSDLANDLERVGRLDLDSLAPALGPPERLERLSELRLKLLSALAIAPAAKRQADAEREKIELEIRALLREQEQERAALLVRLRREVPARLQEQRQGQIESALQQVRQADAASIATLLAGQQSRVRLDFDVPARLFLPAPPAPNEPAYAPSAEISFNKNQFRTFSVGSASLAPIEPPKSALRSAQVLVPSPAPSPELRERGGDESGLARSRGAEAQEGWQALLSKRAQAWRAPAR